jgi:hypothetical protein
MNGMAPLSPVARAEGRFHAGEAVAGAGEALFAAEDSGVRLSLTVITGSQRLIIRHARHSGGRDQMELDVLEALCAVAEERPLQEAADHGMIYVLEMVPHSAVNVRGILSPRNAGAPFLFAERLIRMVYQQASAKLNLQHRASHWYIKPSAAWLAKTEAEKVAVLNPIFTKYLRDNGLAEGDMWITGIERGTRVTVAFAKEISYTKKPQLLMECEVRIRQMTGDPLELFMEELKDANKLRRI